MRESERLMAEVQSMSDKVAESTDYQWFLYSSHPGDVSHYVFQDRVCLTVAEAYAHMTLIFTKWRLETYGDEN